MSQQIEERRTPQGVVRFDAAFEAWLGERGYLDPLGPAQDPRREIFYQTPNRENARRRDGPSGEALFDKVFFRLKPGKARACRRATGHSGSLFTREWTALFFALRAGIRVPRPLAMGEAGRGAAPRRGFLLVRELPGLCLLSWLKKPGRTKHEKEELMEVLGRAVASLHDKGLLFPELHGEHVFVEQAGEETNIGFLDLASASLRPHPRPAARARDLAGLFASLPLAFLSSPCRRRLLEAYLASSSCRWRFRHAWNLIQHLASRRLRLRRNRTGLARDPRGFKEELQPNLSDRQVVGSTPLLASLGPRWQETPSPPGWTEKGSLLLLRGEAHRVGERYAVHRLWQIFGVEAPRALALHLGPPEDPKASLALFEQRQPGTAPLGELARQGLPPECLTALEQLLLKLFRSGTLPLQGMLDHVWQTPDGCLLLDETTPVARPHRIGRPAVRRSLILLQRSLKELLPRSAARRLLIRNLRREAPPQALALGLDRE